jgi:heavy metal sensor kinase
VRFTIRVRLTLWYTAFIAAYLFVVVFGGYQFLASVTMEDADDLLARSASTIATAMEFERNNGAADTAAIRSVSEGLRLPDVAALVLDESSQQARQAERHPLRPMALSEDQRREVLDSLEAAARRTPGSPTLLSTMVSGQDVRLLTMPYVLGTRPLVIGIARSLGPRDTILDEARLALGVGLPLLLVVAAAGGYWLAGKSLAPVAAMSARAREIGSTNLHERLPVQNAGDELGQLATVLNDLLTRVEDAFDAQRRFVAEASHELRTPVAVVSGESEHALSRADRPAPELRDSLAVIRAESLRLRAAIDDLFFLARADAGERGVRSDAVDLADIAAATVRAAQPRAPEREIRLDVTSGADTTLSGDAELLRRLLDNLVSNAISYSTPGGAIVVRVSRSGPNVVAEVVDAGPGIPADQRQRVFERFYRGADARRVEGSQGAGLGLAIAQWIAGAHRGAIVADGAPGGGTVFRVTLPAAMAG